MTTSSSVKKSVLTDEKGNIKLTSSTFGVTLSLVKAGESKDEATGRKFSWGDSVKIVTGEKSIKLTAMQTAFLRDALNVPEIASELKTRVATEKALMLSEAEALN